MDKPYKVNMYYIKQIKRYIKPYISTFIVLALNSIIISIMNSMYPSFIAILFNQIFYENNINIFPKIFGIVITLFIGNSLVRIVNAVTNPYLVTEFVCDLRRDMLKKILHAKSSVLNKQDIGDLQNRLVYEADHIRAFIVQEVIGNSQDVMKFIFSMCFVFVINKKFFFLYSFVIPIGCIISYKLSIWYGNIVERKSNVYGKYLSWLSEVIKNMKEIKLIRATKVINRIYRRKLEDTLNLDIEIKKKDICVNVVNNTSKFILLLLVYLLGAHCIRTHELQLGDFVTLIVYYELCNTFFSEIVELPKKMKLPIASLKRVVEVLTFEQEEESDVNETEYIHEGNVEFKDVCFQYEDKLILDHINLTAKVGERIAIIGESGIGKSTIINLLIRFYEPNQGKILIDGTDIRDIALSELRKKVAIIHQECIIFNDTLRFNLTLGNTTYDDQDIYDMCRKLSLEKLLNSLPNGLDTHINQIDIDISTGEKQRINIARAIFKDSKIIIFDESTAHIDGETEANVNKVIDSLKTNKCIIMVSHRINSIMCCDRILQMSSSDCITACMGDEYIQTKLGLSNN